MRIVIELKRGEVPEVILNNLYKHTQLQQSFGVIMLAIVGGRPKVLNLAELVESFIDFRREVVIRRTQFELRKAEARYHILEGLKIALDNLDAVIKLIRGSKTVPEARDGLIDAVLAQPAPGAGHPRHAAAAADRPRAAEDSRRDGGAAEDDRAAARDSRQRAAADAADRRRAEGGARQVRRRSPHRDHRWGRRRDQHRGSDRRRGHGDYGEQHRLHQAHADYELSQSAARRQGAHRHAHARGGLRQPPLRGVDARLHHDFLGPRPRVLAEGARDSRRRARAARAKRLRTWCRWRPTRRSRPYRP